MKKILLFLLAILLFSCGKQDFISPYGDSNVVTEPKENTTKISIFPTDLNRYWIYESYSIDENNEIINDTKSIDSIVVVDKIEKLGKKGFIFSLFNNDGNNFRKIRDDYYFLENGQVWTFENWLSQLIADNLPINLIPLSDTSFIKILDTKDDLWRIYRIKLDEANIPNLPIGNMSGKADILCSWEGKTFVKTKIGTIEADEYLTTISINLSLEIPMIGKQNIVIEREYTRYFAENIGLIKSKLTPATISVPLIGDFILNGFEKTLINYSK